MFQIILFLLLSTIVFISAADFREAGLKELNILRGKHGAKPLEIDTELNNIAQKWADVLESTDTFEHSQNFNESLYGECIGISPSNDESDAILEAIELWYSEKNIYIYNENNDPKHIHEPNDFTTIIWKATKHVGIGIKRREEGGFIVVANFKPTGYVQDAFAENVGRQVPG